MDKRGREYGCTSSTTSSSGLSSGASPEGAVTLIRAVGHVLDKIDGADPELKIASSVAFKRWKLGQGDDAIFTQFIEAERNTILKEYSFQPDLDEVVPVAISGADELTGCLDENLFRPMIDGYGCGEDARDVYFEAISWWEKQLAEIERLAIRPRV
ncbi:MAG TPA: hypothetical protein PKD49_15325 [Hyphomicrobium sp.]|nr:hypothetical protein [Hyphomicrobium sp.]